MIGVGRGGLVVVALKGELNMPVEREGSLDADVADIGRFVEV